jgi:hypothetical protein
MHLEKEIWLQFFFTFCLFVTQKMTSMAEPTQLFKFKVALTLPHWSFSGGQTGKKRRKKRSQISFSGRVH